MSLGDLEKAVKDAGFADMAEWSRMVARTDLSTPDKIAAFERWKHEDGSKTGLEKLPSGAFPKEISAEEARRVVAGVLDEAVRTAPVQCQVRDLGGCVICERVMRPKLMRHVQVVLPDGSKAWALIDEAKLKAATGDEA